MPLKLKIRLKSVPDRSYDIIIGINLKEALDEIDKRYRDMKKFFITDSNVRRLYAGHIRSSKLTHLLSVQAGEGSKNRKLKEILEDKLISRDAARDSVIIALGGGMIGDLAGFTAATLLRGVRYLQIPTTLLSQVDSSIGGKVAINHPAGKNLIGAFYQPEKVYIDTAMLRTLPHRQLLSGIAEVIKYAAVLDSKFFSFLEEKRPEILGKNPDALQKVIGRSCLLKKTVVEEDETEKGTRRILNFGHTIGHAAETLSAYRLTHGEAVAIGMAAEAKISAALGLLPPGDFIDLIEMLRRYGLPTDVPESIGIEKLITRTLRDKKVRQGGVEYTLLEKIGKAALGVKVSPREAMKILTL